MTEMPERLFRTLAKERARSRPNIREDLVQEARITWWQTHQKHPDKPESYHVGAVRNRMIDCVTRGDWLGFNPARAEDCGRPTAGGTCKRRPGHPGGCRKQPRGDGSRGGHYRAREVDFILTDDPEAMLYGHG